MIFNTGSLLVAMYIQNLQRAFSQSKDIRCRPSLLTYVVCYWLGLYEQIPQRDVF